MPLLQSFINQYFILLTCLFITCMVSLVVIVLVISLSWMWAKVISFTSICCCRLRLFGDLFRLLSHMLSIGLVTLLGSGSVWGVASETQHWAMWSNGYRCTFKPTKPLKPKSKNHDNGRINI